MQIEKQKEKEKVTVIGVGRLGLPMALVYEKAGFDVIGVDVSNDYVKALNNRSLKSFEPNVEAYLQSSTSLTATTSLLEGLNHSDIIFIVVPTPNGGGDNHYDCQILGNLFLKINALAPSNKHFIISCTVMPGYIDNTAKLLLSNCTNCSISYNPEFIAQGSIIHGFENPDLILIGSENAEIADKIESVYKKACKNNFLTKKMLPIEAEITKICINGFITTKITYANMVGDICDKLGADSMTVLNAIGSDSRIGNKYLNPGLSYGGPCFPRDTLAISKLLVANDLDPVITEATDKYNSLHIMYQIEQLLKINPTKDLFVFENVTYKDDCLVPIIEESAKLKMAKILNLKYGKKVLIKDKKHILDQVKIEYGNLFLYAELD
jgi:nucleotide sugar dehydrogenase